MSSTRTKRRSRRGFGTVYPVGKRWRAQLSGGLDPLTKKRVRGHGGYADTEDGAKDLLKRLLAGAGDQKRTVVDATVTVAMYLKDWQTRQGGHPNTKCIRRDKLAPVIRHLGHLTLRELTFDHVNRLINTILLHEVQTAIKAPYSGATRERIVEPAHLGREHLDHQEQTERDQRIPCAEGLKITLVLRAIRVDEQSMRPGHDQWHAPLRRWPRSRAFGLIACGVTTT